MLKLLSTTTITSNDPGGAKDTVAVNSMNNLELGIVFIVIVIKESNVDMLNHCEAVKLAVSCAVVFLV